MVVESLQMQKLRPPLPRRRSKLCQAVWSLKTFKLEKDALLSKAIKYVALRLFVSYKVLNNLHGLLSG